CMAPWKCSRSWSLSSKLMTKGIAAGSRRRTEEDRQRSQRARERQSSSEDGRQARAEGGEDAGVAALRLQLDAGEVADLGVAGLEARVVGRQRRAVRPAAVLPAGGVAPRPDVEQRQLLEQLAEA